MAKKRSNKEVVIDKIKSIINIYGGFSTADLECESSPVLSSLSKDAFVLAERFNEDSVEAISYIHEMEVAEDNIDYEHLHLSTLKEILLLAELFKTISEEDID